jgi:predicted permease
MRFLDALRQDVRHGLRVMRRSPGLTAATIVSLGVGIGANTTIFTLFDALLLRPLPVAEPGRVVAVYTSDFSGPAYGTSSFPDYLDFRQGTPALAGLTAYGPTPVALSADGPVERVLCELATDNYFDVVGLPLALGRGFRPGEDRPGAVARVAVLGHGLWQRRFGSDPSVLGRALTLNGQEYEVVGVAPPGFSGLTRGLGVDVWLPIGAKTLLQPASNDLAGRGSRSWFLMGRLRPGASLAEAQGQLNAVAAGAFRDHRDYWRDVTGAARRVTVLPEGSARVHPSVAPAVLGFTGLLQAVAVVVLLIACANLANLLLARATTRRREMGVRVALGAGPRRLVRQLLTESVMLAAAGGTAGLALAFWGTELLASLRPPLPVPVVLDLRPDGRVLAFTAALSVLTGLLFGLAPALTAARSDVMGGLKDEAGTSGSGYRSSRLRSSLVVAQVAASVLLLVGSGLFVRSLRHARSLDPGFDTQGVALLSVDLELAGYGEERGREAWARILDRARHAPGVTSVALARDVPLGLGGGRRRVWVEGYSEPAGDDMEIGFNAVGAGFFTTLRVPLLRGHGFSEEHGRGAPAVAVVNEAFVRRFWPGQDALGRRLRMSHDGPPIEVVGVARDGKYFSLGEDPQPFLFVPLAQSYSGAATVLARTSGDAGAALERLRRELAALDPHLPVFDAKLMEQHLGFALLPARLAAWVLGLLGTVALLLATLGLYSVIAYAVAQRRREVGIRMALGARTSHVLAMVIGQGLRLTGIGMALGVAGAAILMRLVRTFLYGISPGDPATFAGVVAVLGGGALLACAVPALRATRVDPAVALRYE